MSQISLCLPMIPQILSSKLSCKSWRIEPLIIGNHVILASDVLSQYTSITDWRDIHTVQCNCNTDQRKTSNFYKLMLIAHQAGDLYQSVVHPWQPAAGNQATAYNQHMIMTPAQLCLHSLFCDRALAPTYNTTVINNIIITTNKQQKTICTQTQCLRVTLL